MKVLCVVIVALATVFGVNSLPKASSTHTLANRNIPRSLLEIELRALLAPGFKAALDDAVIKFLDENVRKIILEGSEELGVPVLDPLKIEHLDVDLNVEGIELKGTIDNAEVEKVSTFVIDKIKTNLLLLNAEFGVSVPELVAHGENYDIEGNLGGLLPIYGQGRFSASVQGIVVTGKVSLGSSNSFIYVKALELDVTIAGVKTNFEGLLGGGDISDLVNEIISELVPELFEDLKPEVLPSVIEVIIEKANELLDGVTLQDILDLINGSSRKF